MNKINNAYKLKPYNILRFFFICLVGFYAIPVSYAGHVLGSELTYTFANPTTVNLQLKVYRDCNECKFNGKGGGNNPDNCSDIPPVEVYGLQLNGRVLLGNVSMTTRSITSVLPTCNGITNTCTSSTNPDFGGGIECHILEGVVSIQSFEQQGYCHFLFASTLFSRSNAVTPIGLPIPRFFNYSELRVCEGQRVSSVVPEVSPNFYVNAGQSIYHSPGIRMQGNDSISVSLVPALSGFETEISYVNGRSYLRPIEVKCLSTACNANPQVRPPLGLSVDPLTGNTVFFPEVAGQFGTMVYEIKQFTKVQNNQWVYSGSVRRDFQIYTISASNREPVFENIQTHYELCAGVDFVLPVPISDNQQVTYQIVNQNNGIVLQTSSISNAPFLTGQINWKPAISDQGNVYLLTIVVKDNNCPINAISSRTYRLKVNANPVMTAQITQEPCGVIKMLALPANYADNNYIWRITYPNTLTQELWGRSQEIQFLSGGNLQIELSLNQFCRGTTSNTIQVQPFVLPSFEFNDTHFACHNSLVHLQANQLKGASPFSFYWNDQLGASSHYQNVSSVMQIELRVVDKNGCSVSKNTVIQPYPILYLNAIDSSFCSYDTGLFYLNSLVNKGVNAGGLTFGLLGGGTQLQQLNPGHWYIDKQIFDRKFIHFTVKSKDVSTACEVVDTFTIFKNSGLEPEPKSLGAFCSKSDEVDLYTFFNLKPSDGVFELSNNPMGLAEKRWLKPSQLEVGTYNLQFISSAVFCNKSFWFPFEIKELPSINWIKQLDRVVCRGGSDLSLGGDAFGIWTGEGVTSGYFLPSLIDENRKTPVILTYSQTENTTGCVVEDTIQIYCISPPLYDILFYKNGEFISDKKVCESESPLEFYVSPRDSNYPGPVNYVVNPLSGEILGNLYTFGYSQVQFGIKIEVHSQYCPVYTKSEILQVYPLPQIEVSPFEKQLCSGRDVLSFSYQTRHTDSLIWDLNGTVLSASLMSPGLFNAGVLKSGHYTLDLMLQNEKCTVKSTLYDDIEVFASPQPIIQSIPGKYVPYDLKTIDLEDKTQYSAPLFKREWRVEGMVYHMLPKVRHPVLAEEGRFEAQLIVQDENTCTGETEIEFEITSPLDLYIPNAFSPNGKGPEENNYFKVQAKHTQTFELIIFNRWGEEVFRTQDPENGWDGTFLGVPCEIGVYGYYVKVTNHLGGMREFKGTVSLIR